eukprot:g5858.t1
MAVSGDESSSVGLSLPLGLLPCSVALTLCARFYAGYCGRGALCNHGGTVAGLRECLREIAGVLGDFAALALAIIDAYRLDWRAAYERVLGAVAVCGSYLTNYGLISPMGLLCLAVPVNTVLLWTRVSRDSPAEYALLLCQYMAIAFLFWQFYSVANNIAFHRFFSHRAFTTSRPVAFLLGVLGCTATQRGPLWWASTHRRHHKHCEAALDPHCPSRQGFCYAHLFWIMDRDNFVVRTAWVTEWLTAAPELLILDAFCFVVVDVWQEHAALLLQKHVFESVFGVKLPF